MCTECVLWARKCATDNTNNNVFKDIHTHNNNNNKTDLPWENVWRILQTMLNQSRAWKNNMEECNVCVTKQPFHYACLCVCRVVYSREWMSKWMCKWMLRFSFNWKTLIMFSPKQSNDFRVCLCECVCVWEIVDSVFQRIRLRFVESFPMAVNL